MNYKQLAERLRPHLASAVAPSSRASGGGSGSPSSGITMADIAVAIAAHVALADPHPVYLTQTEGDARYAVQTTTVTGAGALGGGGSLAANRTITMNTPGDLSSTSTSASAANHTHAIDSTIARSAVTITGAGALGGGGTLAANRTITMGTPGTLSVSSTSSSSTNHTHAITASADVSAGTTALLKSASGGLTLATLTTSGAITGAASSNTAHTLGYAKIGYVGFNGYAGFAAEGFDTSTNYALIQSATSGDLYLNTPTGRNGYIRTGNNTVVSWNDNGLVAQSGKYIGSSGYVSGWAGSGWRADQNISFAGESFAEFDNLSIRGTLSVYELVINSFRGNNGTEIYSSVGKIASISGSNWTFEDPEGHGYCAFAANDIVIIQRVDLDATTIVKRIVRRVTSVAGDTVTVTAAAAGPTDAGAPAVGDVVVRIGNSTNAARQGVVLITSDMANSPYQDVISGVTSWADWTGGTKTKIRMGHLSGITGTANEYGFIAGVSGFTNSDTYVKFSSSAVLLNKVDATWRNSSTPTVVIQSDGDIFAGSNTGAVATTSLIHFATAQTYGSESMGAGDVVIGNKSAGHMLWDASAGTLNFRNSTSVQAYINTSGEIVAGSGNVVMNSSALTVASTIVANASGITMPVHTFSTEPSPIGGALSTSDPKRFHQGNLELYSYTVDFDPLSGKRTGATIRHLAPSVSDTLSGGFAYTGSFSRLLLETTGYYSATAKYAYIDMRAGNDNNISRSYINVVADDYIQLASPTIFSASGKLQFGDGSASTPSHSFYSDNNTGMYSGAADQINFATGGTSRLSISTTVVSSELPVRVTTASEGMRITGSATGDSSIAYLAFYDSGGTRKGYIGDASAGNSDIYVKSDGGGVRIGDSVNAGVIVVGGGYMYVNQSSTILAQPAMVINQADLSEEFIDFQGTIGAGNAINTAAIGTYYGKIRVAVNGTFKYIALYNT